MYNVNTYYGSKNRGKNKGKIILTDEVEEIYERKVTPYGNGAKIDSQKNT